MSTDDDIRGAAEIVADMRRLFAGKSPEVQGAALVELVAIFVAGHHPDLRDGTLRIFMSTARELVPIVEHEIGDPWGTLRQ